MKSFLVLLGLALSASAQSNPAADAVRNWRAEHERAILSEYMELLALPNLAREPDNIRRNAAAVSAMFEKRGVRMQLLEVAGAPPAVYGEIRTPNASRTVVLYAHYDGQPLDLKDRSSAIVRSRKTAVLLVCRRTVPSIPNGVFMRVRHPTTKPRSSRLRPHWMR